MRLLLALTIALSPLAGVVLRGSTDPLPAAIRIEPAPFEADAFVAVRPVVPLRERADPVAPLALDRRAAPCHGASAYSEPAMLGEVLHQLRVLYARAMPASPATDSMAHALGTRSDAALSSGSLHAKVKDIKDNPPSVVNSIQRGTVTTASMPSQTSGTGTATITSVTLSKTVLIPSQAVQSGGNGSISANVELTDATTVTINAYNSTGSSNTASAKFHVLEHK